jgi:hypothetical protein
MSLTELLAVKLDGSCVDIYQERELCARIYRLTEAGVPLTSKISKRSAFPYCKYVHIFQNEYE